MSVSLSLSLTESPAQPSSPASIKGFVKNSNGEALVGATVGIAALNQFTLTDARGAFQLTEVPAGSYTVTVRYVGHEDAVQTVTVSHQTTHAHFVLQESTRELSEVEIVGKTDTQLAREQPIKAEIISTRAFAMQPATLSDLMNRTAGIRVRQTGGLGSYANLMLNGFQGQAIKYFRDDIPMDYLGAGYNFALVPVNMLERLEIYKGVLPVRLGADALGGAVNMITKRSYAKHAEASYEIGSFNTHRASVNLYYQDTIRKFFAGADLFVNYSDNNYDVTVDVTDEETSTQRKEEVKLFHNTFKHYYGEVYGGVTGTRWADELRLSITGFWLHRDNQYGATMDQAFGAATSRQYSVIPTLRYKKSFLNKRLQLDQFLVSNTIYTEQVDTVRGTYTWHGVFKPNPARRGEMTPQGTRADTEFSYFTSRTNLAYRVNDRHRLELNVVYMTLGRIGRDPLGLTFAASGRDILSVPADYDKLVAAAGWESRFLDGRITHELSGKFYRYETRALDADYEGDEINRSLTRERWGAAEAIRYTFRGNSFIRFSAEVSTRLPEQGELFGDGNLRVSNFALRPERSTNFNLGYRLEKRHRYTLELNSFYRITHDLILNVPYNLLLNRYENVNDVRGLGFEADATVSVLSWLKVNGNFTYQDFRMFDTHNKLTEDARLRNTPFFFANLGLTTAHTNVFRPGDKLQAFWYYSFVREYYLDYVPRDREPGGLLGLWGKAKFATDNIIPNQSVHTVGLTYFPVKKFSVSAQARNLLDADIYDNFRIQNAGRSLNLKLTYIFL
ncbi:TonB-dependent receptor [Dawidia soli]|uniref:Carboxypeptidase-like regulatory domain-containing protein n=1 Tax=Dawidia soli TaxID=2782352 RepID=A0AAP2D5V1_9BACT|nr:TonB-dependent receptor [Dawidia soli]MBT1685948.1 carboxypeptidase-like regulatory domain-containing protein [Dawidia soli]